MQWVHCGQIKRQQQASPGSLVFVCGYGSFSPLKDPKPQTIIWAFSFEYLSVKVNLLRNECFSRPEEKRINMWFLETVVDSGCLCGRGEKKKKEKKGTILQKVMKCFIANRGRFNTFCPLKGHTRGSCFIPYHRGIQDSADNLLVISSSEPVPVPVQD